MKTTRGLRMCPSEVGLAAVITHVLLLTKLSWDFTSTGMLVFIGIAIVMAIYGYCTSCLTEMFQGNNASLKFIGITTWYASIVGTFFLFLVATW